MGLLVLRCFFILASSGVGIFIIRSGSIQGQSTEMTGLVAFFGILFLSLTVIAADIAIPRKRVDWISAIYFGLLVGLILTYVMGLAIIPLFPDPETTPGAGLMRRNFLSVLAVTLCYICVSFLLQTRNDFRFIIPYVEFSKELRGSRPLILDTSVVIDGRIADVMDTSIVDNQLIMPRFAIAELQRIADSSDRNRRTRGRRGLDVLSRLQNMKNVDLEIDDAELPEYKGQPVDLKLVTLAKHLEGKLVTNDYNLNKVASLQGVVVINLNDLANALKPVFLPGERLDVDVVKVGEEVGQGIGYLEDGTMVVIEGGRNHISQRVAVTVTSVLQTSAGRMIFGRFDSTIKNLAGVSSSAGEKDDGKKRPAGGRPSPKKG
jgi:uncharacterized protein YacL